MELADATEAEEQLVPLPKLTVEAARLPKCWLLGLPAKERLRSGVFPRASTMADRDAGSASGGESCHLCIGSRPLSVDLLGVGIVIGSVEVCG